MEKLRILKDKIKVFEKKTGFTHGRIEVCELDDWFCVKIDGSIWSNDLNFQEAEDAIDILFKGIELANER